MRMFIIWMLFVVGAVSNANAWSHTGTHSHTSRTHVHYFKP